MIERRPWDLAPEMPIAAGEWRCQACSFTRTYGTLKGALNGAAAHLLQAHDVRLALPERSHSGLYGGGHDERRRARLVEAAAAARDPKRSAS